MYDSDSDGRITLEEYRNVKYAPLPTGQGSWHLPAPWPGRRPKVTLCLLARQVVEELLSGNPHIEKESARSIADGAMMEAASVCVGQMVSQGPEGGGGGARSPESPVPSPAPWLTPTPCPACGPCFWKAWWCLCDSLLLPHCFPALGRPLERRPRQAAPQRVASPPPRALLSACHTQLTTSGWEGISGLEKGSAGPPSLGTHVEPGVGGTCKRDRGGGCRPRGWRLWRGSPWPAPEVMRGPEAGSRGGGRVAAGGLGQG